MRIACNHVVALAAAFLFASSMAHAEGGTAEDFLRSLHPRSGRIELAGPEAMLQLGQDYDFLGPDDAKRVLVEAWGNPPESAEGVLGIVTPHGASVLDDGGWSAVVTYEETFYVDDAEVTPAEYETLLNEMRQGETETNAERRKAGYREVHLVGWAQPPAYEAASHNLIWARRIAFTGVDVDTLNYDIRHLGRRGVLSLNIVGSIDQLPEIRAAAPALARTAEFQPGSRYADHQWMDKKSGYGLVGLVAAGAGLAVAKKAGLLALIAIFAKKGLAIFAVGAAAAFGWLRKTLGPGGKTTQAQSESATKELDKPRDEGQDQ